MILTPLLNKRTPEVQNLNSFGTPSELCTIDFEVKEEFFIAVKNLWNELVEP